MEQHRPNRAEVFNEAKTYKDQRISAPALGRKRYTAEGLKAIREKAPVWLQNAIDLALITTQRRTDILDMRFDGVRDGYLYLVQKKTAKASDAAWIRFRVTPELQAVISRCRVDTASPYLVHQKPDRPGSRHHGAHALGRAAWRGRCSRQRS